MTGALAIGALVVVVVVAIAWARIRSGRSDRRSMETYGHRLAALGDVSKRTGPPASVRVLPRGEAGRAHVRTDVPPRHQQGRGHGRARPPVRPERPSQRPVEPPARSTGPSSLWRRPAVSIRRPGDELGPGEDGELFQSPAQPVPRRPGAPDPQERRVIGSRTSSRALSDKAAGLEAGDAGAAGAEHPQAPDVSPAGVSSEDLRRRAAGHRVVVATLAALSVALIVVASVLLTGSPSPSKASAAHRHRPAVRAVSKKTPTTTTTPSVVAPISMAGAQATYKAPSGAYTLMFTATTGACWVGVETGPGTDQFLWTETVEPGSSGIYRARGPVAVVLGAAPYIEVSLNGVPVKFPTAASVDDLVFTSG